MANNIVKYTSRDYDSIMEEFWRVVPTMTDLWRPEADSDPGVVLGKFLASVADMLGTNLDLLANEIYAPSVSQRKNAERLFALIGYSLGNYVAAKTQVTFRNNTDDTIKIDFGFNGANFSTLNAYTDITNQSRVLTYNIIPLTNEYGDLDTRSTRKLVPDDIDVFAYDDVVTLGPGDSVSRIAIEGEFRSASFSVEDVKKNNYIINLPSQHVDTTALWMKAKTPGGEFVETRWIQVASPTEFLVPEPRFMVSYDNYSNARIQVSTYLNELENYSGNFLTIYWLDCSGVIGCVGKDVLSNLLFAKSNAQQNAQVSTESGDIVVSNYANTLELPHTPVVTGRSPETAKEAYYNSRNYINTWDSLITLPDFNRFLNREPGVDCGYVLDCQKALEINLAIYNNRNLTDAEKAKMYITNSDFPAGNLTYDWSDVLDVGFDPSDPNKYVFATNFQTYTAMCFAIHNNFKDSSWGPGQTGLAQIENGINFVRYKPPVQFIDAVKRDYRPLQAMTVELEFGYLRVFPFYVVGQIYPKNPVTPDVANSIVARAEEALALFFDPAARKIGQMPTVMEVVKVIEGADSRIDYFDAGSLKNPVIYWYDCDPGYFNAISFARLQKPATSSKAIRIAPEYIVE